MSEMRCVLAGVQLRDDRDFTERFQETNALCEACGFVTVGTLVQRSRTLDPNTGLRSGKAAELAALCRQSSADIIVLHNNVSAGCAARLAQLTETEVIDRTALILRIFSMRARTKEARLQTEIARLSYLLPVSTSEDTESHKRGGSYANRGAGEMRRAQLASRYRGRIAALKKELAALERRGMQSEKRRN
ncbi:MAG: hypothetical protein K6G61_09215, partial [Solobacterium sp.]|nr:hypothetical protein [Solobacterium sp.]